jgi:serine/threonine-protein kinase RsbT
VQDAVPGGAAPEEESSDVTALLPMVRRIVYSRVGQHPAAEDLVQETLVRVLAASATVEPGMLEPYTVVTAKNVIASMWRDDDRHKRNRHRVVDLSQPDEPDEQVMAGEEQSAVLRALARLPEQEREALLAHEVSGQDTRTLASEAGSTPGAVAAQLKRTRARLRVEYLLALEQAEPPSERCRIVLFSLSGGDRRRQKESGAARHLLECEFCRRVSEKLGERNQRDDEVRVRIAQDADVVSARQAARDLAERLGFSSTDLTILATAVSEVARNILRFADTGEVAVELVSEPHQGVRVTAMDNGPGIRDVELAMTDGFSTNNSLGLGLPGARRLMDEFSIESRPGQGTTVTMAKWRKDR